MPEAPVPQPRSTLYALIEERLERSLVHYIAEHRPTRSWKWMATDLTERTGTSVSWETLRLWFADRIEVKTEVTIR